MKFINSDEQIVLYDKDVEVGYIKFKVEQQIIEIKGVYVYPGYRKNGYGKLLCDELISHVRDKKYSFQSDCWFFSSLYPKKY